MRLPPLCFRSLTVRKLKGRASVWQLTTNQIIDLPVKRDS